MSKRPSPSSAGPTAKRARDGSDALNNQQQAQAQAQAQPSQSMDPEELSDALHSAGVNLREEENLLSSSLQGFAQASYAPKNAEDLFLDLNGLVTRIARVAQTEGIRFGADQDNESILEAVGLLSASCQEWIAEILTEAAVYSRHRRMSKNDQPSQVGRALRMLAQKDRESEQRHTTFRLSLGLNEDQSASKKQQESEEIQHRAANDTARMMTAGKKRFSWLNSGSSGNARQVPGPTRRGGNDPLRFREVKEEPGLVMRDLLTALDEKHMGVKRALVKGYVKQRD